MSGSKSLEPEGVGPSNKTEDGKNVGQDSTTAAIPNGPNLPLVGPAIPQGFGFPLSNYIVQPDEPTISPNQSILSPQLDITPDSAFSSDDEFGLLLMFDARDWSLLRVESYKNISFLLLSGRMQPTLWLPEAEALRTIDNTIRWHRAINRDPHWTPLEVSGLCFNGIEFRSSLDDSRFRLLFLRHLGGLPAMFLTQVRNSIQALLLPPPSTNVHPYPRTRVIPDIRFLLPEDSSWLRQKLRWDDRWGYDHWHGNFSDSGGFTVYWFTDTITRDILYHALHNVASIGWLTVAVPDEDERSRFRSDTSVVLKMVAFVLSALALEMHIFADSSYCPPGVHDQYIERLMEIKNMIEPFLQSILDESNPTLTPASRRDASIGLRDWLLLRPVY